MSLPLLGLTLLLIGDSHFASSGYLITTLHDDLTRQGAKVVTLGACGVAAGAWVVPRVVPCGTAKREFNSPIKIDRSPKAKSWSIDALIQQYHPNAVIVGLGDTMGGYSQKEMPTDWIASQVSSLTARLTADNVPCLWLGPGWGTEGGPYFKTFARTRQLSDYLATVVSPCHYVDSTTLSKPGEWPTFDGQHYTAFGYQKWGEVLSQAITRVITAQMQAEIHR
jgi:hypothetical protein